MWDPLQKEEKKQLEKCNLSALHHTGNLFRTISKTVYLSSTILSFPAGEQYLQFLWESFPATSWERKLQCSQPTHLSASAFTDKNQKKMKGSSCCCSNAFECNHSFTSIIKENLNFPHWTEKRNWPEQWGQQCKESISQQRVLLNTAVTTGRCF